MKLKFKNQEFQTEAVHAVTGLFAGQEKKHSTFSVTTDAQMSLWQNGYGFGNQLLLEDTTLLKNMNAVQKKNNLPYSDEIDSRQFSIEMETGTGKTYVYTKTIFELHKQYGFLKFIIVVPSVAIREGVYKSFEMTREHFALAYDNMPYHFFIYNSARLNDVREFATSANIEIMIINIDAFRKAENIINQAQDRLNGETAMRFIQDTCPIVIIDEPQSVDNTQKAKEAIASLNPLCVLRYSATHKEKINLLYRLTPVDAYQMGLVKQICVSSNQVVNDFNKPYIALRSVAKENGYRAKVEMDVQNKNGKVSRKVVTVKPGDDLFMLSGERELYEGYAVEGIDCTPERECIEFSNTEILKLGKAIGAVDELVVKREQIKRTIETHLNKELRYLKHGIKVLSLFFIDEVKKYRLPEGGKGVYAELFEECYQELMDRPKYAELKKQFPAAAEKVHDGYFSQDKKGNYKNTKGDTLDDYNTYNTIMKDKEWLLSYDCPLRFIFSHSALKEGWDNPNVFQVCTLIDQKSTFICRQKIGRGLRLCVNQDGDRIEDRDINVLHVMANESFSEFAANLQKEIEEETGVRFGVLEISLFSGMVYSEKQMVEKEITAPEAEKLFVHFEKKGYISKEGKPTKELKKAVETGKVTLPEELQEAKKGILEVVEQAEQLAPQDLSGISYTTEVEQEKVVSHEDAAELLDHFEKKGYLSKDGQIKDTMKNDLKNGTPDLPKRFEAARKRFESIIRKADRKPPIRDASKEVVVKLNKQALLSPEFMALWDKIKQKTIYQVQFDESELIRRCVKGLQDMPEVPKARIVTETAELHIERSGVTHTERGAYVTDMKEVQNPLPDILLLLQEGCSLPLSLKSICTILLQSGRLRDFVRNPQMFMECCTDILNHVIQEIAIDGIRYVKLAGEEYYIFRKTQSSSSIIFK